MTRPARILLVTPRYPPALGGVERVVEMLVAGLVRRQFEVQVVTTDPSRSLPASHVQGRLSIHRFPTIRRDDVFFLSPRLAVWLLRQAGRFDLIHAHSYHSPLALISAVAARLHHVPFVVSPHYHGTGHTTARGILHRPYRLLGAWMIRQAALVICASEAECALIRQHFGTSLTTAVVNYGVDTKAVARYENRPIGPGTSVLVGGRLEEYKQVDVVVRAMAHLPSQFRLVVFGDGPASDDIKTSAREVHVAERVDFVGRVSDDELSERFLMADVFVSLSRREAFGLTVIEAAAQGTVAVCSDIPAYREIADRLPDGAIRLISVDSDPTVVAQTIMSAAAAPRQSALPASLIPSWDRMVAETVDGYRTVLAAAGRAGRPHAP